MLLKTLLPIVLCLALVPAKRAMASANTIFLDNGQIRLGLDLDLGGAVTYLADSHSRSNLINSWDKGREIQLSFYSGPVPFQPPGSGLAPDWRALGWNPIQAGDAFGHGSKVTSWSRHGQTARVHCVPMIWPLNNVPAECEFDVTYKIVNNTVEVQNRLVNHRSDATQYPGRAQELPAIYSNGQWYKLVSYTGADPFSSQPPTTLVDLDDGKGWPWLGFFATEHWAALLDKNNEGLGIFEPAVCRFSGGFAGKPKGFGGPKSDPTGYIAPNLDEILDANITYDFTYTLIVGSLDQIRSYATTHAGACLPPQWNFKHDRQHWTYVDATDTGWPIKGKLDIHYAAANAALLSPVTFWRAEKARTFEMTAAFATGHEIELSFQKQGELGSQWMPPIKIPIPAGPKFYQYKIRLVDPSYTGPFQRLKLTLPPPPGAAQFHSITLAP